MAYIDVSLDSRVLVGLGDDLAIDFGSCFWRHCGEMEVVCTVRYGTGELQEWELDIAVKGDDGSRSLQL